MAEVQIGGQLVTNARIANIDALYGPYETISAAETRLGNRIGNANCVGLTVGIKQSDGKVKEYWVQPYDNNGVTAYHLVEKGAGTTDYNELDNKPTISDGGQGSTQIPLLGNVKVTATAAASGQTTGVAVTAENGGITMAFTLEKGADGVNGTNGTNGIDGKSAFEVWRETTNRPTATEPEYIADLQTKVAKWIPVAYEATAASATIGDTVTFTTAPSNPIDGAIVIMPNAASNATATMMFAVSEDPTTQGVYIYTYIGDLNVDTTGLLGIGDVDGTQLANPLPNALAKATDVMPLAVKLKGVTANESKYPLGEEQDKAINGNNGNLCSDNYGGHFVVNLDTNTKKVRFQATEVNNQSTYPYGYCFYSDSEGTVAIQSEKYKLKEGSANQPYELIVEVPQDAVVFKFSVGSASRDSAYCYLQTGESVGDALGKVQPDEQLSTTSEKPIANKTITNFLFDNFTKEEISQHLYKSLIKVTGEVYSGGSGLANFRVYAVIPGKQYILSAFQSYYTNVTYAFAGFYALPENYVKADINTTNVCKGKDGDVNAPYIYRDEDALGRDSYKQNMILNAPEGATHLVLVESKPVNDVVEFPANLRVVSVATEQQEEELVSESVKTALTPTPNALLMKNVLKSQNRNYYIESVDITDDSSSFDSYTLKSYIDRKIATIPEGKHFMMWTDAHIDYNRYGGDIGLLQDTVPVMAYIKEKLGISYIINGGDNLGADSNQYKAAGIIEKYMIDCFEAFGRGLINVVGNHDWNKTKNNPKISDYETWKRMFQPMELFGDVVYAQNVLHNIETCELLTDDEKMNLTAWAKMNYYIDDNKQKIRYYVTVTDDPGSIAQGAEMINGTAGNFMVFVDFFAGALNTIPEGYDFVFVGHQRLVNPNRNENNPYWIFYKLMGAWKKKTNVSLGGGNSYDSSIFHGYKIRDNKVIAKWITSGNWDDNGLRTFDFSNHKGSGRVFTLGGHYHRDRAAFTSTDNRVFAKSHHDAAINGNTEDGNILYDLEVPTNNAYAEAWADAILGIDVHCTTIGGSDSRDGEEYMIVHRYKVNNEWVEDSEVYDYGADWTGNEYKVYADYYGHRKSILWPIGGPETYRTADSEGTPFESVSAAEQSFPTSLDHWVGTKILIKESESAPVKVYHVVEKEEGGTTTYSIELLNYGRGTFGHYFDDATNNEVLADDSPLSINRIGNVNEICCDVITITDDNHVVCTRFGAGFDRDYKLPSIPSYSIYAETAETAEQTTENAGE